MNSKRVALFDFCETLVPFQTGDKFLFLVIKTHGTWYARTFAAFLEIKIVRKLIMLIRPNINFRDMILPKLKGIQLEKINEVARDYSINLKKSLDPDLFSKLKRHSQDGFEIIVVSGGYEEYLYRVFEENELDRMLILGTKLHYQNDVATGRLSGMPCLSHEKITRLYEKIDFEIDKEQSFVYSDCLSDLPLFNLVDVNKYLVNLHTRPKITLFDQDARQ